MLDKTHHSLEEKKSKRKCGICCIPVTSRGVLDCCSDTFCFGCIDTWSAFTNLCPLCKLKFKFITFVPVEEEEEESNDLDTNEDFLDILGQEIEESWIAENEEEGALSFPSYFIEDAIVCLDGDGCDVRAGRTQDGEVGMEDTSVACDACECWYHACCVRYKTDFQTEKSWICPRCIDTGALDLLKYQMPSNKGQCSNSSSRSDLFNKDSSITFVDEGETAVVVSMDASNFQASDLQAKLFEVDFAAETNAIPIKSETECIDLKYTAIENSSTFVQSSRADNVGNQSTLYVSPENLTVDNTSNSTSELPPFDGAPKIAINHMEALSEHQTIEIPPVEHVDIVGDEALEANLVHGDFEVKEKHDEPIYSKKREPPQNQDETLTATKRLKSDHGTSLVETDCASLVTPSARRIQKKMPSKGVKISKEKLVEEAFGEDPFDEKQLEDDDMNFTVNTVSLQDALNPKSKVMDELKELVQGISPCHRRVILPRTSIKERENGKNEGTKSRKIVYQGRELDTNALKIVDQMRQYLQESSDASNMTEKIKVTDERFFTAFKTAILNSQANTKWQDSPLQRTGIRKPGSKLDASRKSLMKKLYGGSGKRRQTWDRDWDISFWRERISHEKKAKQSCMNLLQKEISQIEGTFCDFKKEDKAELDSLRSRIYLADTSLLPRKDDIKPLSAQLEGKQIAKQSKASVISKVTKQVIDHPATTEECPDNKQTSRLDKRQWALDVLARKNKQINCQRKKGSLLEELPGHLRPILEYDRRSKVPTASRQMQLDRFVEYYLQQAQPQSFDGNPECKAAIAAAVSKEKEIYDRSNSKGVYVNLCVQALSMAPKEIATQVSKVALFPMAETGEIEEDMAVLDAWKATGLISDSPPESPVCGEKNSDRSLPKIGNSLDVQKESSNEKNVATFEVDEDSILDKEEVLKDEENRDNCNDINEEMPTVLSGGNEESIPGTKIDSLNADEGISQTNNSVQPAEDRSDKEPATLLTCAVTNPSDQEMGFFGTEKSMDDISQTQQISKQVETYVKEHIRPLLRSHVITTEQYRWAITKTTKKVMQHHAQARSASFLISEGEKVKRLAEQYLALYTEQNH